MALQENDKEKAVSDIVVAETIETIDQQLTRLAKETPPFYKSHSLLILYMLIIPGCLMPAVTLGFNTAIINGLQAVPAWDEYFDKPRGTILGLLNAVIGLGCIVATPFISFVGNRWGRHFGIFFGAVIMLVGGVIQGASINIAMFVVSRFIIGFGLVFANTHPGLSVACVDLFFPETSGRSLETIAEVFDGPLLVDAEKTRYNNGLQDIKKG